MKPSGLNSAVRGEGVGTAVRPAVPLGPLSSTAAARAGAEGDVLLRAVCFLVNFGEWNFSLTDAVRLCLHKDINPFAPLIPWGTTGSEEKMGG